ncbi:hypothetical protein [Nocardia sp. N2S4-5]|uniref:hypothetical protein n=1 Tax=Nocardia sp. N2S4-5 TaxID=3351565 RepID=UPI0037D1D128
MLQAVPSPGHERPLCAFPGCKHLVVERSGRPGRPPVFCANPEHNYSRAYDERRKLTRAAAKAEAKAAAEQPTSTAMPVTSGIQALSELVSQLPEMEQRFAAVVADAHNLVADIADPQALQAEAAHIRAEADLEIAKAKAAQARAERAAARLQTERNDAVQAQRMAEGAADEAITARDAAILRADRIAAETEREIAESIGLRDAQLVELMHQLDAATERAARAEADRDNALRAAQTAESKTEQLQTSLDDERRSHAKRVENIFIRQNDVLANAYQSAMGTAHQMRDQIVKAKAAEPDPPSDPPAPRRTVVRPNSQAQEKKSQ